VVAIQEVSFMSIWKRLIGSVGSGDQDDGELFTTHLTGHIKRVNALGGSYASFVGQYFSSEVISMLSAAATEKMALTRSDSKEHSFCCSQAPVSYWICTIPYSVPEAKKWFGNAYGGYSKLLERAWSSDHFRGPGCEVLVHVVFGRTRRDGWVNVTIFPVGSERFGIKPILPLDLLTEAEMNPWHSEAGRPTGHVSGLGTIKCQVGDVGVRPLNAGVGQTKVRVGMRRLCEYAKADDFVFPLTENICKPRGLPFSSVTDLFTASCEGCATKINGEALSMSASLIATTGRATVTSCPSCGSTRFIGSVVGLNKDEEKRLLNDRFFRTLKSAGR
jgi:hypothetical protein